MKYILILKTGRVMTFTVLACAELYAQINGGTLITNIIENETQSTTSVI
jgi:hypothetical protein